MQLHVEVNNQYVGGQDIFVADEQGIEMRRGDRSMRVPFPKGAMVIAAPDINEDFWMMRVPVSKKQAIVCFEKFMTIGIGFQVEDNDWNTNLPWTADAEEIYDWIKVNKGQKHITRQKCIAAIKLLQSAISDYLEKCAQMVKH